MFLVLGGVASVAYGLVAFGLHRVLEPHPRGSLLAFVAMCALPCVGLWIARGRRHSIWSIIADSLASPLSGRASVLSGLIVLASAALLIGAIWEWRSDPESAGIARSLSARLPRGVALGLARGDLEGFAWLGAYLLAACGLAPWFEELFFRAFLWRELTARAGIWAAWLVSGVLFCAYHNATWTLLLLHRDAGTLLHLGLVLFVVHSISCVLLRCSRSVVPGIVFHACANLLVVFVRTAAHFGA